MIKTIFMRFIRKKRKLIYFTTSAMFIALGILAYSLLSGTASASHSWSNYHWARQNNPFTLKLSSNLSSVWPAYLSTTSSDWSLSTVLDTTVTKGTKNPKTCKPTLGQVEICNANYGNNGWLGMAQIWISNAHITQGAVKINDTYMSKSPYDTPVARNHVMCHEVGHTLGLGHQDVSGASLGTCMDYSSGPSSQKPNQHDYDQLMLIYAHLDSTTTVAATAVSKAAVEKSDLNNRQDLGRRVFRSKNGLEEVYVKVYKDGSKIISFVTLAQHQ